MIRMICAGFALAAAMMMDLAAAPMPDPHAVGAMEKFLASPAASRAYRASRRLEAAGSGQRGWLDAETEFSPTAGLRYEIVAEGGSGYIRSRVLRSLLEEERQLIARGGTAGVAISPANYRLTPEDVDQDGLAHVALQPLRKEGPLIIGRMFLAPDDGQLVRVEGKLAKSPSFWITRVNIVRSYQRINDALVPVLLESTAQLRFLGRSTLRMTYRYSIVDGRPVGEHADDVVASSR